MLGGFGGRTRRVTCRGWGGRKKKDPIGLREDATEVGRGGSGVRTGRWRRAARTQCVWKTPQAFRTVELEQNEDGSEPPTKSAVKFFRDRPSQHGLAESRASASPSSVVLGSYLDPKGSAGGTNVPVGPRTEPTRSVICWHNGRRIDRGSVGSVVGMISDRSATSRQE